MAKGSYGIFSDLEWRHDGEIFPQFRRTLDKKNDGWGLKDMSDAFTTSRTTLPRDLWRDG
jgi:hypothetical protein